MKNRWCPFGAVLLAALITACGGTTPSTSGSPPAGPTGVSDTVIQGTITGARFPTGTAVLGTDSDLSLTNRGTLQAPGTLNFPLSAAPEPSTFFPLLAQGDPTCTFTGTVPAVNPQVSVWNGIVVLNTSADFLGHVTETVSAGASGPAARILRVYSTQATTVNGTQDCGYGPLALDVTIKAGWNALEYTATTTTASLRTLGTAAQVTLEGELFTPSVGVLLDQSALNFGSGASVTVPTTFLQIGGYSGTVSLSTDVPGLTVEPATVTLAPLSTQGVPHRRALLDARAQRLDTTLTFRYTGTENLNGPFTLLVKDPAGKTLGTTHGTIQTTRPGFTLYSSGYNLILPSDGSLQVPVCASSVGGFSGSVTFSATRLPAGVSVTPSTVPMTGSVCTEITLKASSAASSGKASITLTGVSGSAAAQTTVDVTLQGPAVSASFPGNATAVYQGGDSSVIVDVTGRNGFSGATTLTLSGLPAGITAAPTSVTVTPGGTTRATITLHATATATLGTATIKVSSPDFLPDLPYLPQTTLNVRPARVSIPSGLAVARASSGVWQVTDRVYYTSVGGPPSSTLILSSEAGTSTRTVKLPLYVDTLISTSGGVLALSLNGTIAGYTVKDDGTYTAVKGIPVTGNDRLTSSTDARGRVWYVKDSYSTGTGVPALRTWNPATGAVTTVDTGGVTPSMFPLVLSGDGKYVLSLVLPGRTVLKYATATDTLTTLHLTDGFTSAAVSSDGTIWVADYGSRLSRVNADGTLSLYATVTGTLLGFDTQNPTILWGADSYSSTAVYRIDTTGTPSSVAIVMSDYRAPITLLRPAGGVYVETLEYQPSGTDLAFLSILK